jgi:hypothetical protein
MALWYFPLWHHGHNCHSDYRNNGKYHRAIHSYTSINGGKHSRNNCHWNYWLNRHNCHSDYKLLLQ